MDIILKFLKSLAKNNNREWFEKNKDKYLEAKNRFDQFTADLLKELTVIDSSLIGLDPKKLTFRIYRDVRFSKDKSPYKKNFGAAISGSGKGLGRPGYYIHIEPGNKSFIAGGLFMPEADLLAKVRQEIDYNGKRLEKIVAEKSFKKYFKKFYDEDALKTSPKGFPKDHQYNEWLKLRSFIVSHQFSDTDVVKKSFLKNAMKAYLAVKPLNSYLAEAIS